MSAADILQAVLIVASSLVIAYEIRDRRRRRRTPAAPDNQQGTNARDLWTCRHILRETETRKEKK